MRKVTLKDIAPARTADTQFKSSDEVWQLTLDQIESQTGKVAVKKRASANAAGVSTFAFDKRNVLYSKLRPYLNKVVCPDEPGIATTELVPLRPVEGELDRDYLAHYLRSPAFVNWISNQVVGAKMPRVNMKVFWEHEIPIPPLPEQKRIAAILDKADSIRRKRAEAIRLADDFLKSTFLDMFGDPVTNPMGWEEVPLCELGKLDRGVSKNRPRNAPELLGGPYPLVQTGDVANSGGYVRTHSSTYSEIGLRQSKIWPAGTLCITIAANIANTGILTYDACFPDSVVGFVPNHKSTVEYVQALIGFFRKILDDGATQVAQKNINLGVLRELCVPAPPIKMQKTFTKIVERTNVVLSTEEKAVYEIEAMLSSLQQRAFQGEL